MLIVASDSFWHEMVKLGAGVDTSNIVIGVALMAALVMIPSYLGSLKPSESSVEALESWTIGFGVFTGLVALFVGYLAYGTITKAMLFSGSGLEVAVWVSLYAAGITSLLVCKLSMHLWEKATLI
ncbi:hypothetical protein [Marinobacter sp. ELB17]|uniref:hypothetical protein n=1 Tax=Marinobacter sp. ELB17 TaxID=270374 RepID=UPI0000F381FC|nr:hypothetical protein [Marinobacter sp. ELB17]EAZ98137.1 hypothetical protein MELB17_09643 [Marinobacter sp. ELB17]